MFKKLMAVFALPLIACGFACYMTFPIWQGIYERAMGDVETNETFNLYPGAKWMSEPGDYRKYIFYWTADDVETVKRHYESVFPAFHGDEWLITAYTRDGSPTGSWEEGDEALCKGSYPHFTCIDLLLVDLTQPVSDLSILSMYKRDPLPTDGTFIIYTYTTGRF